MTRIDGVSAILLDECAVLVEPDGRCVDHDVPPFKYWPLARGDRRVTWRR